MRVLGAAAALLVVSMTACSGQENAAFADAKKAVAAKLQGPPGLVFEDLQLRHVVGLKGSKADVVCGDVAKDANSVEQHFLYVWKLQPAVSNPDRTQGETMVFGALDRRAAHELTFFCTDHPDLSSANEYDYFN